MKKLIATYEKIKRLSENGGNVYIRCAGAYGQDLRYALECDGIHITAFLDGNYDRLQAVSDIPVLPVDTVFRMKAEGKEFFVLAAIRNDEQFETISRELTANGLTPYEDFCDYSFLLQLHGRMKDFSQANACFDYRKRQKRYATFRLNEMHAVDAAFDKTVPDAYNLIGNLDVPLTTYCSLKCKHCSHCMPYANPPKHFEAAQLIEDLDKVLSVSYIACVCVMGGEPFVYPKIAEFFERYRALKNSDNIGFTRIVTNGTVMPGNEFFAAYKKIKNAYIYFSNYGKESRKMPEMIEKCKEFGIPTYVEPYSNEWTILGDFTVDRHYSEEELKRLFAACVSYGCTQLLNGRVYSCCRVPLLNEDGLIPFSKADYCEIRRAPEAELRESLHRYLYETPYLNGCKYCDGMLPYAGHVKRGG